MGRATDVRCDGCPLWVPLNAPGQEEPYNGNCHLNPVPVRKPRDEWCSHHPEFSAEILTGRNANPVRGKGR